MQICDVLAAVVVVVTLPNVFKVYRHCVPHIANARVQRISRVPNTRNIIPVSRDRTKKITGKIGPAIAYK